MTTQTKIHLGFDETVRLLRRTVMEKGGDYVYPGINDPDTCWYFEPDTGKAGCIVGHVLSYRGMTMDDLAEYNVGIGVNELIGRVIDCSPETAMLLEHAQTLQDQGEKWLHVVRRAEEYTLADLANANELDSAG